MGTTLALAGVAWVFYTDTHKNLLMGFFMMFILFFSVSQGAVIWVYISEVFPSRVRSKGQSVGASSHWIMNAIIAGIFPYIAAKESCAPVCVFCGDDGAAVFCGAVCVSGDEGADAGGDPGGVWDLKDVVRCSSQFWLLAFSF